MTAHGEPTLDLPAIASAAVEGTWAVTADPGPTLDGGQRVALAAETRRARMGHPVLHPSVDAEVVNRVAAQPAAIRAAWVSRVIDRVGAARYVELVGLAARTAAVDTFAEALGRDHDPLPAAAPGAPTGAIDPAAGRGPAWVPMTGGASITQALSLAPSENDALRRLHEGLYLSYEQMADPAVARSLTRPQMELVAARTSALNECFY